jgi:LPS export ABC transporter protein LptC
MVEETKTNDNRLSSLKVRSNKGNVRTYSRFIRSLKIAFPLIIIALIGLLIIWPQLSNIAEAPLTKDDLTALQEAERENILLNPVFNTLDAKQRPLSISAAEARQNRDEQDKIYMAQPRAAIIEDNRHLNLSSGHGIYDQANETLILIDAVKMKDNQGNVLSTEKLTTDITNSVTRSESEAVLTTPQGTIHGQSVILDHANETTTFQGPAKAVIFNENRL